MQKVKKINFDLSQLAETFGVTRQGTCQVLVEWLNTTFELNAFETQLYETLCEEISEDGDYWNEEELKIQFVGTLFRIANINVKKEIKVFYERPLSAKVGEHELNVICDCLVAKPMEFHTPQKPYFFLQEFKKGKGEKRDPEAQMLTAMLISQVKNNDNFPIYGGYLVGSIWVFTTLHGKEYCASRKFDAANPSDLMKIISILKNLKPLILKH